MREGSAERPQPSPKRIQTDASHIPDGFGIVGDKGHGGCLFQSVARALSTSAKTFSCIHIRAEVTAHMRKHAQQYEKSWDRECSDAWAGGILNARHTTRHMEFQRNHRTLLALGPRRIVDGAPQPRLEHQYLTCPSAHLWATITASEDITPVTAELCALTSS